MQKKDIVKKLTERNTTLASEKQADKIVGDIIDIIKEGIRAGEEVELKTLVKFKKVKRPARKGRNPQTGEEIQIPEKIVVVAKASKGLSE